MTKAEHDWREPFDVVVDLAREQHPASFCQAVVGRDGARGEVWLTGPASEDLRRELARLDPPGRLIEDAPYNEAQMEELRDDMSDGLRDAVSMDALTSVGGYTVETDTIEISVGGPGAEALSAAKIAASITRRLSERLPPGSTLPRVVVELRGDHVITLV